MPAYFTLCALLLFGYAALRHAWAMERLTAHPCWCGDTLDAVLLREVFDHEWAMRVDEMGDGLYTATYHWLECEFCGTCTDPGPDDYGYADELPF